MQNRQKDANDNIDQRDLNRTEGNDAGKDLHTGSQKGDIGYAGDQLPSGDNATDLGKDTGNDFDKGTPQSNR